MKAVSLSIRGIKIGDGPTLRSELKKKLYKATKVCLATFELLDLTSACG